MKKKLMILITLIIFLCIGVFYYFKDKNSSNNIKKDDNPLIFKQIQSLKESKPELREYIDKIILASGNLEKDKTLVENYSVLGLAWKSLADRTNDSVYYEQALNVYKEAITLTNRTNTLFLINAGNMSIYLKNYNEAEEYYKEAVKVAPGDSEAYVRLADLYHFQLNRGEEEILKILDQGIKRMIVPLPLIIKKASYFEETNQYKKALTIYKDLVKNNSDLKEKYKDHIKELEGAMIIH